MPTFGTKSQDILQSCHLDLQLICNDVIQVYDFSVLEGYRSNARQAELLRQGKSKLGPGQSKHNNNPSLAVDIAPYPIDWNDKKAFYFLSGLMFMKANELGIALRWGGDWNRNFDFDDQTFFDLPHFELVQ